MIDCDFSNVLFWTSRPLLAQYSLIWFLLLSWISIWLIMTTLIPFPSSRWALKTHLLNIFYIHSRDVNDFLRAAAPFGGELLYGSKRHSFYLKNTKRPNQLLFIQNFQWKTVVWSSDSSPKQRHEGSPLWDRHKWTLGRNGKYILNLFLGSSFLLPVICTGKKILPAFTQSMVTPLKAPLCKQFHLEVTRRTDWFFWIIPQFDLSVPLLFMDDTGATHSLIPRLPIVYRIEDDYYETANEDIFLMNSLETGGSIST